MPDSLKKAYSKKCLYNLVVGFFLYLSLLKIYNNIMTMKPSECFVLCQCDSVFLVMTLHLKAYVLYIYTEAFRLLVSLPKTESSSLTLILENFLSLEETHSLLYSIIINIII